jgi:cysteine desulfurase / selenocysteine lyase
MEHHSNIVPWQMAAARTGARLAYIPVTDDGELDMEAFGQLLEKERPKLVAVTQMSNVLGTLPPVHQLVEQAHQMGALVLLDGAQSVPHLPVDVRELGCDFLAFSARRELLEAMPPFLGGGDMIREVSLQSFTCNDLPWKFEAGTPAITEAVGLGAAVDYLSALGMEQVRAHEQALTAYALEQLGSVSDLVLYGPPAGRRGGVCSFTLGDIHAHDLATILDSRGVAVRAGHHCAQPLMERYQIPATARASFYVYTTVADIDTLIQGLLEAHHIFGL